MFSRTSYLAVLSVQYLKSFNVFHTDTIHSILSQIELYKLGDGPRCVCKLELCWLKSFKLLKSHIYTTLHFGLLTQELLMVLALREDCLFGGIGIVMPGVCVVVP